MYLDAIAEKIREQVPREDMPSGDTEELFRLYALLLCAKGVETTPEDVHNAWAIWMARRYESHEALRPFVDLDETTKRADLPFVEAIRRTAGDERRPTEAG
jgi:hypothetical protein